MIQRYELSEGTSNKFWETELQGKAFVARWGRIGTKGQEKRQSFKSEDEARRAQATLIAEKTKKGYRLVSPAGGKGKAAAKEAAAKEGAPAAKKAAAKRAAAKPSAPKVNAKLEELLAANREDEATWQVYADWLLENGEPWGEIIVQACSGKKPKKQLDAVTALLEGLDGSTLRFKHGVVETLELLPEEYPDTKDEEARVPRVLEAVLRHPAGRLVRALTLGLPPRVAGDIRWHFEDVMAAIGRAGPLPLLEVVDMTANAEHMDQDSWRRVGDIRALWKAAPRLRELRMKGSRGSDRGAPIKLGTIEAPRLEKLIYISSGLDKAAPVEIGAAKLPSLTHLELYFGQTDYGNNCTMKSLAGILEGKGLPKLRTLGLMNSPWEAELVETIARSPILRRIEHLDLSKGVLFTEGAEAIVRHAAKLAHIKSLDLADNFISREDMKRIRAALPKVDVRGAQRDPEEFEGYRYTAIGE